MPTIPECLKNLLSMMGMWHCLCMMKIKEIQEKSFWHPFPSSTRSIKSYHHGRYAGMFVRHRAI